MISHEILSANKDFCIEETVSYINLVDLEVSDEINNKINFCRRDITYVLESYIEGLKNNSDEHIKLIASRYWKGNISSLVGNKKIEIVAHTFLKDLINNFILKGIEFQDKKSQANQIIYNSSTEDIKDSIILITHFFDILVDTISNGPEKLYLHNHLANRFTAKWWDDKPLEEYKVEIILEAAYQAPSKQGNHEFEMYVLTNSSKGKEIKQWLYWENTFCLNKIRAANGEGLRRYNGQVLAPIVILWLGKNYDKDAFNTSNENNWIRTANDFIISSTMAMCQAEELGVRTGFCGTLGGREIAQKLQKPNLFAIIAVGFGYAVSDNLLTRKVFKNNKEVGFDLSNTDPRIRTGYNRVNRPNKYSMINYI